MGSGVGLNVQFPVFTTIDPDTAIRPPEAMKSWEFIKRFNEKDTAPIQVTDDASQAARDQQVIKITRGMLSATLSATLEMATDKQILDEWRDYMNGRF